MNAMREVLGAMQSNYTSCMYPEKWRFDCASALYRRKDELTENDFYDFLTELQNLFGDDE